MFDDLDFTKNDVLADYAFCCEVIRFLQKRVNVHSIYKDLPKFIEDCHFLLKVFNGYIVLVDDIEEYVSFDDLLEIMDLTYSDVLAFKRRVVNEVILYGFNVKDF